MVALRPVASVGEANKSIEGDPISLKSLLSSTRTLSGALELDEVLDAIERAAFDTVPRATHLTVVLRDESNTERPEYVPVTTRVRDQKGPAVEAIPTARSVVRKVIEQRAAVLAADAMREVGETASIMGAKILSTMAVPLWKGDEILGVLQVDNRASAGIFKERDLDLLMLVAQQASLAVANARLYKRVQLAEASARSENSFLKQRAQKRFEGIIGDSSAMKALFLKLSKVIDTRVTVLVEGETGTGKELVASAVHYQSRRKDKLFIAQNCAALPENLLESELFGHKKGSFTGATEDKKGLFELADGGTLFLDEIGEMPLSLQAKILRVLQEGEVQRLVIQSDPGSYIMAEHLSPRIRNIEGLLDRIKAPRGTLKDQIEHIEKWLLIEALREHKNNKSATAKTLGITREGLHKKLKGYGIG